MSSTLKKPTIRDVAAEAGVSKSLVSLVYSSPKSVSAARKEKVLRAAEKLGYAPNFLARSLAADSGTFVAILVADLHNPLFAQIADGVRVRLEAEKRHYFITSAMIKRDSDAPYLDKQTLRSIVDLRPDSLLVIGSIPRIGILEALPKELPIIFASGVPIGLSRAATVRSNEEIGMKLVVDHLVSKGHKNIAYISGVSGVVSNDRLAGYESAMSAQGLTQYIDVVHAKTDDEAAGYLATKLLLNSKNPPTAISCFNDLQAIGAQTAANELKSTVSLVGYDNTYLSGLSQIELTSVDPGNREIANTCADLILSKMVKPKYTHFSAPSLVVRTSTERKVQ